MPFSSVVHSAGHSSRSGKVILSCSELEAGKRRGFQAKDFVIMVNGLPHMNVKTSQFSHLLANLAKATCSRKCFSMEQT